VPLHFLLDEHLSPDVAEAVERGRPGVRITAIRNWRNGAYLGADDEGLIAAAHRDQLTLVTYDRRTIVPLMSRLASARASHGGVVLVDDRTIAADDIGRLARALTAVWDVFHADDWTDRVVYLAR
jgi:hypothetical protein